MKVIGKNHKPQQVNPKASGETLQQSFHPEFAVIIVLTGECIIAQEKAAPHNSVHRLCCRLKKLTIKAGCNNASSGSYCLNTLLELRSAMANAKRLVRERAVTAALVLTMIILVSSSVWSLLRPVDTPLVLERAISPNGSWTAKILGKWESSYFILWIEAFESDGAYIGRMDIALTEGAHEVELYRNLVLTDSEAVFGDSGFRRVVLKSKFAP